MSRLLSRFFPSLSQKTAATRNQARCKPLVELLEDRVVPAIWYTTTNDGTGMGMIDTTTGTGTVIGSGTGNRGQWSGAYDPTSGIWYGVTDGLTPTQAGLVTINMTTGVATPVGAGFNNPVNLIGLEINNAGTMYGLDWSGNLFTINKTTGQLTSLGNCGATGAMDLAYDPSGTLWASGGGSLFTVNTTAVTSNLVSTMSDTSIMAIAFDGAGTLFATAYTSSGTLYSVNTATGALTTIASNTGLRSPHGGDIILNITIIQSAGTTNVTEGGATDTYTAVLATAPTANVTVGISPNSQVSTSVTQLVFTPSNWATPQTVTVTAVDDAVVEGPHTGVITHTATSSDTNFNAIAVSSVTANITDNDFPASPGITVTETAGSTNVAEGGATDTYSIVLEAAPTANVVITLNPGTQLSTTPTSLTFTTSNWSVPQTVTVAAVDDTAFENAHTGVITHTVTSSDTNYNGFTVPAITANIGDNDFDPAALVINGTEKTDKITVTFGPTVIQVAVNGKVSFYPNSYPSVRVNAFSGANRIQIVNQSVPVLISGGTGKDDVIIDGWAAGNAFVLDANTVNVNGNDVFLNNIESLLLTGKSAADMFAILAVPSFPVTIQAGSGKDTLLGPDIANTWRITASDAGTLDNTIKFSFIENLMGGADDDGFWFAMSRFVSGQVDGGAGNNWLDFSAHRSPITVNLQPATPTINITHPFLNIATILGGLGSDRIIGPDLSNTWDVVGFNQVDVAAISFSSFENLTGGAMDDTFLFTDGRGINGKLDGGGGADILDFSAFSTFVIINLQTKQSLSAGGRLNFTNVESFTGGSANDTFIGANRANAWDITDAGTGAVGTGPTAAAFAGFENLTGGSQVDTFNFQSSGDWLGLLDGGTGLDVINSPGWNYTLTGANAGTVNGRTFKAIENRR